MCSLSNFSQWCFLLQQAKKLVNFIGFANRSLGHVFVMPRGYVREISYSPRNKCGLRRSHQQGPATARGAGGPWAAAGLIAQPEKRQYLPAVRAGDGKATDGWVLCPRPCWLIELLHDLHGTEDKTLRERERERKREKERERERPIEIERQDETCTAYRSVVG